MAFTDYFVDPSLDIDYGSGTIGDPFGDLQYALDTVTRNATDGDRFNIKSGTDEVITGGNLSLALYGAPNEQTVLIFRGYTAVADTPDNCEVYKKGTAAIAYEGRRGKASWWYKYPTEEVLQDKITGFIARKQAQLDEKAIKKVTARLHNVGDILYSSWGYDQTNIDFYQVTSLVGKKMVMLTKIASRIVPSDNQYSNKKSS